MNRAFLVAGGDLRMKYAAGRLAENSGNSVYLTGNNFNSELPEGVKYINDFSETGRIFDYLVLPAPSTTDGETVNAPFSEKNCYLSGFLSLMKRKGIVFGGMINETVEKIFLPSEIEIYDYLKCEEFSIRNAVPTAEGAIQIAMEEMPSVLYGKEILITGYGRIARVLSKILCAMGCSVTVSARKKSDIVWASVYGCRGVTISEAMKNPESYDVIFNTVPAVIMGRETLGRIKRNCLIIELASSPGGIDLSYASEYGHKIIRASGLPGKKSPETAGCIIADTVMDYISERSMMYE
ncbi:MAG: dipicolinate synthase subunit DpsA [Oscillospiraceae bacterium]|nr:dipicolinate synthase subunit DpsA [Oscillospiraceae bacterium]